MNETMARQFWPREFAVGKRFLAPNGGVRTVVGIVADTRHKGPDRSPAPTFFEAFAQTPSRQFTLIVRTTTAPLASAEAVRRAIRTVDPSTPITAMSTVDSNIWRSMAAARYRVVLMMFFAIVAVILTSVRVGAVAMRALSLRIRELCIRIALGASPRRIVSEELTTYARVLVCGLAAGLILSLAAMRGIAAYLFGVTTYDLPTYAAVAALLAASSLLAGWLPLRAVGQVNLLRHLGDG